MGLTNGLDVLQQQQQLAGLQSLLPAVSQQKAKAHSRLATLLGVPRSNLTLFPVAPGLLTLPPFPSHLRARDLFERRPDLLSLQKQTFAAEYQIAARLAERFPTIGINLSYNFSTEDLDDLFEAETGSIGLDANLPLTDGGRRRAQIRQAEARSKELLQRYIEQFVAAANEVATLSDVEELKLLQLEKIALRFDASQNTLKYSRERYQNGALEYLQVLLALQTVQEVERIQLEEQARLLQNRITLHQALGQPWRVRLTETNNLRLYLPERKPND
jgi:multidrug efflux system outer membrane protein